MNFKLALQLVILGFTLQATGQDHKTGGSPLLGRDARDFNIQNIDLGSGSASSSGLSAKARHRPRRRSRGTDGLAESRTWGQAICNWQNLSRAAWFTAGGFMVGSLFMATGMCLSMKSACNDAESNLGQCNTLLKEIGKISALVCKLDPSLCN